MSLEEFLSDLIKEYKVQIMQLDISIEALESNIKEYGSEIKSIDKNFDSIYNALYVANDTKNDNNIKKATYEELINDADNSIRELKVKKESLASKMDQVNLFLNSRDNTIDTFNDLGISQRISFVIDLIDVEPERAKLELKNILSLIHDK